MPKIPIYFMPGLAAGPEIFENLTLDKNLYDFYYLTWKNPTDLEESITDYAKRMAEEIHHENVVLVGVSFGGIMVQEMSKWVTTRKIILISTVKSANELPKRYKLASMSKVYKLFPTKVVSNFEDYTKFFLGKSLSKKAKIYKKYLSVRDELYIKWGIHNVLHWQQETPLPNTVHIHGTKDNVFPIKHIENVIKIDGGTHIMILTKAKTISEIIHQTLTC